MCEQLPRLLTCEIRRRRIRGLMNMPRSLSVADEAITARVAALRARMRLLHIDLLAEIPATLYKPYDQSLDFNVTLLARSWVDGVGHWGVTRLPVQDSVALVVPPPPPRPQQALQQHATEEQAATD